MLIPPSFLRLYIQPEDLSKGTFRDIRKKVIATKKIKSSHRKKLWQKTSFKGNLEDI